MDAFTRAAIEEAERGLAEESIPKVERSSAVGRRKGESFELAADDVAAFRRRQLWPSLHQQELLLAWERASRLQPPGKIEPLP